MKKFFILTVLAIAYLSSASAQVTWNVRAGGGMMGWLSHKEYMGKHATYSGAYPIAFMTTVESNIPMKSGSGFCFSPSVMTGFAIGQNDTPFFISLPLHVGYKIKTSVMSRLIPKIGVTTGFIFGNLRGDAMILGPSVALCYEYKRLVLGVNGCYNLYKNVEDHDAVGFNAFFSVGYKF